MTNVNIIYPILAMVLLTIIIWLQMYYIRITEAKRAGIGAEDLHPFNRNLPKRILTSGDNFKNLFEIPVLFYACLILLFTLNVTDNFFIVSSWLFVLLRYVHSFIHVTYNKILHRFIVYVLSCLVLWVMWGKLGFELLKGWQ